MNIVKKITGFLLLRQPLATQALQLIYWAALLVLVLFTVDVVLGHFRLTVLGPRFVLIPTFSWRNLVLAWVIFSFSLGVLRLAMEVLQAIMHWIQFGSAPYKDKQPAVREHTKSS